MTKEWMIYGAYGYTGTLIAKEAKRRGLKPILAGRRENKLLPLARELDLPYRVFDLENITRITSHISTEELVLHCAGPFSTTSLPMAKACLQSKSHYLDITGEIAVFESLYTLDEKARHSGIVLCPGVGFDVVPTDCLAAMLKEALPDATSLILAFDSNSPLSRGTLKTSVEGIKIGGRLRENGLIKAVPLGYKVRDITFNQKTKKTTTIPWGDIATAYYTTGIPNIEVFMALPLSRITVLKRLNYLRHFLSLPSVQNFIKRRIDNLVYGPNADIRTKTQTYIWGEVKNAQGEVKQATLTTANAYNVTVYSALGIIKKLITEEVHGGFYTPSQLMGKEYISTLPGSSTIEIF